MCAPARDASHFDGRGAILLLFRFVDVDVVRASAWTCDGIAMEHVRTNTARASAEKKLNEEEHEEDELACGREGALARDGWMFRWKCRANTRWRGRGHGEASLRMRSTKRRGRPRERRVNAVTMPNAVETTELGLALCSMMARPSAWRSEDSCMAERETYLDGA